MNLRNSISIALCFLALCVFSQCKTQEVSTTSKKAQSIYNVLKLTKFSDRTFDKMLTNAKRDQGHFELKKFKKDLIVTEHNSNGFKALTISTQTLTDTPLFTNASQKTFELFSCDLGYVDFNPMSGVTLNGSSTILIQNNNMSAGEVNHV
jgi:hypothetical protein